MKSLKNNPKISKRGYAGPPLLGIARHCSALLVFWGRGFNGLKFQVQSSKLGQYASRGITAVGVKKGFDGSLWIALDRFSSRWLAWRRGEGGWKWGIRILGQHSTFNIQHSTFNVQLQELGEHGQIIYAT
jgi:hypothetical protein